MSTVVQKFDADGKSVERELEKMRREYDKLLAKMDTVVKQSNRSSRIFNIDIGSQVVKLGSMAAGYLSLQNAAALFNAELERRIELEKRTTDKNITVAASQSAVRHMIGNVPTKEYNNFLKQIENIQTGTGFSDIATMNMAAASILSATGSNQKVTTEILAAVAPVFRHTPERLAKFAGATADVMNVTKTDARSAASLAISGTSAARIDDLGGFSYIAKALGSGRTLLGDNTDQDAGEQIMALFGTMSRFSKDAEGGPTSTAVITFLQKLEQFGGEGGVVERLARVQEQLATGKLKESEFLSGFEKASFGTARLLIRGDDEINSDLKATIASTKGTVDAFDALASDLTNATPQLRAATLGQRIEMTTEQSQLSAAGGESALLAQARAARAAAFAGVNTTTLAGMMPRFDSAERMFGDPLSQAERERRITQQLQADLFRATQTEQVRADRELVKKQLQLIDEVIATLKANTQSRNAAAQSATHTER
jgi:hypothetical protein